MRLRGCLEDRTARISDTCAWASYWLPHVIRQRHRSLPSLKTTGSTGDTMPYDERRQATTKFAGDWRPMLFGGCSDLDHPNRSGSSYQRASLRG